MERIEKKNDLNYLMKLQDLEL